MQLLGNVAMLPKHEKLQHFSSTCQAARAPMPSLHFHSHSHCALQRCIRTVDALAAQALLDADPPTRRLRMRIRLNVDDGDVRQALLVRSTLRIHAWDTQLLMQPVCSACHTFRLKCRDKTRSLHC